MRSTPRYVRYNFMLTFQWSFSGFIYYDFIRCLILYLLLVTCHLLIRLSDVTAFKLTSLYWLTLFNSPSTFFCSSIFHTFLLLFIIHLPNFFVYRKPPGQPMGHTFWLIPISAFTSTSDIFLFYFLFSVY